MDFRKGFRPKLRLGFGRLSPQRSRKFTMKFYLQGEVTENPQSVPATFHRKHSSLLQGLSVVIHLSLQ